MPASCTHASRLCERLPNPTLTKEGAMVLHLGEADVKQLLTMTECIEVLDDLFHQEARGQAENKPTTEFHLAGAGFLRLKPGLVEGSNCMGFKSYSPRGRRLV